VRELRLWAAAAAAPVVAAGFYALAALRRRRSLHPAGVGFKGQLLVSNDAPDRPEVALLRPGATYGALLRFSRGAGLPELLPDALGVAIKLPDAHGPGADQDLLLTRSTSRPLLRRLLFPARSFVRGAFSTALPYDLDGKRVVVLLVPAPTGKRRPPGGVAAGGGALAELRAAAAAGLGFELRTAGTLGPSQRLATLTVDEALPAEQTEALRFNPWTTGPGIRPSGWLNLLRDAAYRASQRGRQG
jgi:hypothetical protein